MKNKKSFLLLALPVLALSACGPKQNRPIYDEEDEDKPLEIGDTVREWSSNSDFDKLPLGVANNKGRGTIVTDTGNDDSCSLSFTLSGNGYIGSDAVSEAYFTEDDAKNGDIISLWYLLPQEHNIKTLKLEATTSNNATVDGDSKTIEAGDEDIWTRMVLSYDTLDTLGSIRLNYTLEDPSKEGKIILDDINITFGEETVKTDYEYNDESLYQKYEGYFKVGGCLSNGMLKNTEIRKLTKHNFNSITAENEGKPEQILDQAACQEAARSDNSAVVIKTSPFEKLYNWAEASHIGVRHHTFAWYSQTPAWFFTTDYTQNGPQASRELMLSRLENFIGVTMDTINERWPGLVYAIDVANEAVENGHVRNTNNKWTDTVGEDFVYHAFKYAYEHKAEDQELYYNDFSFDYQPSNCRFALNNVLKDAITEGLIDGVGIQGHLDSNANMDNVIQDAKMIKEKGLKCQITELDITINGNSESELNQQKKAYKDLIKRVLENNDSGQTDINAVIVWGTTDNTSWKRNQNPLLFTNDYGKKPCYYGFLEALDEANITREEEE
ncbi:MAG: endo-1,4-beta-xylanase [Bacilli bacterium]|nr:endo-1,4-beta-xylanase [Bacilli bacterium]